MRENSSFSYGYGPNDSSFYVLKYFFKILFVLILYRICKIYSEDTHNVSSDVSATCEILFKELK